GNGSAKVDLDGLRVENNAVGVLAFAPSGTTIQLEMRNSEVSGNSNLGFAAESGGGVVTALIDNSTIANNGGTGGYSQGTNSFLFVSRCTITGNGVGWTFNAGGNVVSFGNNNVALNIGANGTPSGMMGQQ